MQADTTHSDSAAPRAPGALWRKVIAPLLRHAVLIVVLFVFVAPFAWMVITALKTKETVFSVPIVWWPETLHWENFLIAANYPGFPFIKFFGNSFFYSTTVTIGTVLSCATAGYGFARLRFPGRDLLFGVTVATLMIPTVVTLVPSFLLFKALGWLGGYAPLIVPAFFGNAFFIFMMRQFYQGLPTELADAARVDGAGEFRIFWQIMLPLVRPALLVMAVFTFLWTWHEFFMPLIFLSDSEQYPLSLGLYAFRTRRFTEWHLMMAGATLTTLPLIVMFFVAQKYFLEGIKMTGLKG